MRIQSWRFKTATCARLAHCSCLLLFSLCTLSAVDRTSWQQFVGKTGPSGWRVNVIQPDPLDHGPDGFNWFDWDGDGDLDVFINFEEGGYSRLYFNPGKEKIREQWTDFIELEKHGPCEDSGIGDLNNDGLVDYIANGGHIFLNPGPTKVRDPKNWTHLTLFTTEARVPVVSDVDGDGLNDLIVGGNRWYKQPKDNKHDATQWTCYQLGKANWTMTCIVNDIDGDGDNDIIVQERKKQGTFYFENPGPDHITKPWPVHIIDPQINGMFMALGDVNGDGRLDIVKAAKKIRIFLRTNDTGIPTYKLVEVEMPPQPASVTVIPKPKGVALLEMNGNSAHHEILIIPAHEAQLWYLELTGNGMNPSDWQNVLMDLPGPETRKKMDNAYLVDLDGDGDLDVATTEENSGWGVIWFENPGENNK